MRRLTAKPLLYTKPTGYVCFGHDFPRSYKALQNSLGDKFAAHKTCPAVFRIMNGVPEFIGGNDDFVEHIRQAYKSTKTVQSIKQNNTCSVF